MVKWWLITDWTKTNKQLAQEFSKSYNTVAKRRVELGFSGLAEHERHAAIKVYLHHSPKQVAKLLFA